MVERQDDVAPRPLAPRRHDVDRAARRIADDDLEPGPSGERLVERALEAVEAAVVGAGEPEHVRRDAPLRVRPPLLGVEAEAGDAHLLQRLRLDGVGLPLDEDEALRPVAQGRIELVRVELERLARLAAAFIGATTFRGSA